MKLPLPFVAVILVCLSCTERIESGPVPAGPFWIWLPSNLLGMMLLVLPKPGYPSLETHFGSGVLDAASDYGHLGCRELFPTLNWQLLVLPYPNQHSIIFYILRQLK